MKLFEQLMGNNTEEDPEFEETEENADMVRIYFG